MTKTIDDYQNINQLIIIITKINFNNNNIEITVLKNF